MTDTTAQQELRRFIERARPSMTDDELARFEVWIGQGDYTGAVVHLCHKLNPIDAFLGPEEYARLQALGSTLGFDPRFWTRPGGRVPGSAGTGTEFDQFLEFDCLLPELSNYFSPGEAEQILDWLDHGEYGLAMDDVCVALARNSARLTESQRQKLCASSSGNADSRRAMGGACNSASGLTMSTLRSNGKG